VSTRRTVLTALALTGIQSTVRSATPASGTTRRIGLLSGAPLSEVVEFERAFLPLMKGLGWMPGQNLFIERAVSDAKLERLTALANELAHKRVDVIVTGGGPTTLAAARATRTVPIVFSSVIWPIEQGLIDSYERPGRNVTGPVFTSFDVINKRLQLLRETAPDVRRLAWVWPRNFLFAETLSGDRMNAIPVLEAAAKGLGFEPRFHALDGEQSMEEVFKDIVAWPAQAITAAVFGEKAVRQIADFALRQRLPSVFPSRGAVDAGGLLSYGAWDLRADSRLAGYVDRILRGARPSELPVELPSRFALVINMRTAKTLGLFVPKSLLLRSDEVIE
jgi:putative ABC transport system substrate-binding protein